MHLRRMKVVLTRKLAESMDGINVAAHQVGDVLDLEPSEARLLVAERWATPERRREGGTPPATERRRTNIQAARDTLDDLESVV
jgi:hypothetical protein